MNRQMIKWAIRLALHYLALALAWALAPGAFGAETALPGPPGSYAIVESGSPTSVWKLDSRTGQLWVCGVPPVRRSQ
jgi:hypothetical protein